MAHKDDSDWHFKMGLLALKLGDLQWAERFNDQSEFLTLKRGWEIYNPYALHASKLANKALLNNRLDLARAYIKFGFRFHPYSRDLATESTH